MRAPPCSGAPSARPVGRPRTRAPRSRRAARSTCCACYSPSGSKPGLTGLFLGCHRRDTWTGTAVALSPPTRRSVMLLTPSKAEERVFRFVRDAGELHATAEEVAQQTGCDLEDVAGVLEELVHRNLLRRFDVPGECPVYWS